MKDLVQIFKFISGHPLAGKHKTKAVLKFLRWQIAQRLLPYPVEYPYVGKTTLLIKKGQTGATGNIYTGLHDFSDMGFLLHFLRSDDLFIDVGANVGSYTILAAGYIGARTVSIEPVPQTFEQLRKNIMLNNLEATVKIINCGIGASEGKRFFTQDYDTENRVVLTDRNSVENLVEIAINKLDKIAKTEGIPSLIKVDVEGFEQEVINGSKELLANINLKAIIIELNGSGGRYQYSEEKIHRQLLTSGFRQFSYDPFKRQLEALQTFGSFNTLYIRDFEFVESRVKSAPFVHLFSENF